jgi:pimeloyl-ACP methyl ester carboxylesterase
MNDFREVRYRSADGLQLYARDYPHPEPRATVLCLHGLTRNSADFEGLCEHLRQDFRVIAADQRGRGRSACDPNPANYNPGVYVQDMFALLAHLGVARVVAVGTSMGGLMTMMIAAMRPDILGGAILNDIGPVVDPAGLARIKGYVGRTSATSSWSDAARISCELNGVAFPTYTVEDWMRFARRTFREDATGQLVPAYDPAIAQSLAAADQPTAAPDMWPLFMALRSIPTLLIRGALSDILSSDCAAQMRARKPDLRVIEVPDRGHAPMLDEPAALQAIRTFLMDAAALACRDGKPG